MRPSKPPSLLHPENTRWHWGEWGRGGTTPCRSLCPGHAKPLPMLSCGSSFTPLPKTTASQLHSASSTRSQVRSLPQFPQLSKSYPRKAWQEPAWAISHLGATPTVSSPTAASARQNGRAAGRKGCPCPLARLSRLGGQREQGAELTQGQGASAKEAGPTAGGGGVCVCHFVPCPQAVSAASIHLHPCLPAVLTGQHCHLLPAARQDAPALPVPPSPGPPPALLAGDCVPAGTLQHRVPQALGQHPRHRVHKAAFRGCPTGTKPCGQHRARGTSPAARQPCFSPTKHLQVYLTQGLSMWLVRSFAANEHATAQQRPKPGPCPLPTAGLCGHQPHRSELPCRKTLAPSAALGSAGDSPAEWERTPPALLPWILHLETQRWYFLTHSHTKRHSLTVNSKAAT